MRSQDFEFYVDGVTLTTVSFFGLVGTLMSIRVLLRPHLRNSFSNLLIGLAVCDASFLSCAILIIGLPKAWPWYQTSASVYVIPIVYGMIGIARTGSVYLTMSVTLERYFAIVRPLASFRIKRCLIPISITFAGLYNIPRFFELERYNFTYTNETLVRATKLRENSIYVSIYNTWMKMVFLEAIPYITIIVLNALIVRQIVTSGKFRRKFATRTDRRRSTNGGITTRTEHIEGKNVPIAANIKIIGRKTHSSSLVDLKSVRKPKSPRLITAPKKNGRKKHFGQIMETSASCPNICVSSKSKERKRLSTEPQEDELVCLSTDVNETRFRPKSHSKGGSSTEFCSRVLRRVCRRNGSKNRQQQQELSLGLTLVTISILFILCQSVKIVPDLYERFCRSKGITSTSISGEVTCHSTKFIDTLISLANLFACINSAANFLIYMLRGKKFRKAFLSTYAWKKTPTNQTVAIQLN